jgi:hypothetical protein
MPIDFESPPILFRSLRCERRFVWADDVIFSHLSVWKRSHEVEERMPDIPNDRLSPKETPFRRDTRFPTAHIVFMRGVYWCPWTREFWGHVDKMRNRADLFPWAQELEDDDHDPSGALLVAQFLAARLGCGNPWTVKRRNTDGYEHSTRADDPVRAGPWRIGHQQAEIISLKRWLHDGRRKENVAKAVVARAVKRRIRRHGLTTAERNFFSTMFGASKFAEWVNASTTHENAHHGLQIAS